MSNKADAVAITDEGTSYAELGHARLYVWNTGGLVWERMTQPGAGGGGGGPVTVADGADVTQGALADAAIVTNTTGSISGKLRGLVAWAYTRMPAALGQTTMAGSLPVTIASDQTAIGSVTVTGNPLVTNAGIITDNAVFTDGTTKLQAIGYILDEVAGTALTENDMGAARMDSKRALVGTIEDATTRGQRAAVSAAGALKVDGSAATQPVSGTVTANPATANGKTLLFASVSVAASGANAIVAADAVNKIKVVSYALVADAAVTAKWQNAATDLTGPMSLAANGGVALSGQVNGHLMETSVNQALNLNLGGAVGVRGHISYFKEP